MSKRSGKRGKVHSTNRNTAQVYEYKSFLDNPRNQPDDTVDVCNDSLIGSDVPQYSQTDTTQNSTFVKMALYKKIYKLLKENGFIVLLLTVLISIGGWTVNSIHRIDVISGELSVRIEYLEKDLNEIVSDSKETEILESELEKLKLELSAKWGNDINDIENRIILIEHRINELSE